MTFALYIPAILVFSLQAEVTGRVLALQPHTTHSTTAGNDFLQHIAQIFRFFHRVLRAKGEPHGTVADLFRHTDAQQHVAGVKAVGVAGRAGRGADAVHIEVEQDGLALQTREADVGVAGQTMLKAAVQTGLGDVLQDVFAKLWTQPEVWLENKDIGQYIYDMTKNTTFNFIKRKRLEQSYQEQLSQKYLIEDLLKSEDTLDPIYYKEALLIIRLILDRLPERRRKVFEMSRINNMSNMEIAQALNISVRTVEHQIYLTLLEIKKLFLLHFSCVSFK